ncbi:serine/threonine protein phosphatase [Aggregatimonas sangjinii]|uniref:Serine/threonine protein phosphatase n=1 Tax=Aggregatimonas sangjinii TaxID=2583587 RepID=A0A5B7SYC2_9FLAO|nr:metallophosphoesterase [Aggregatimonas sangjinii]QCX02078.1 serine/threonine protein phosphatase [Aggregatimonas sangjinii]
MRTLVIGDIHSGLKALKQLFERADVSTSDKLIFLGDYVDGWSDAVATVDFLINLKNTHDCIFLRGNHDELCYDWLAGEKDNPIWRQHGGSATMASYEKADAMTKKSHIFFYEGLHNYYLDTRNRLFLHAGFTNLKGVDFEYFQKTFYWDRTLWELALSLNPDLDVNDPWYPKRLTHYKEIYIGHTPVTRMGKTTPQQAANVWNVDTGAAFKGPLSLIDIDSKQVWQSEPAHTFYPNEKGRN